MARQDDKLDQQFIMLYEALFDKHYGKIDYENFLTRLNKSISYSVQDFKINNINSYLLNQEDIVIINNMAITFKEMGKDNEAINTLLALKNYLENQKYDYQQKRRTYPVVLYNLSKWQGLAGNLAECLVTCDKGIEFCIQFNVLSTLPHLLFNKGCALIELESSKLAEEYMKQAYYILVVMKEDTLAQIIIDYGIEKLGKNVIEIN